MYVYVNYYTLLVNFLTHAITEVDKAQNRSPSIAYKNLNIAKKLD